MAVIGSPLYVIPISLLRLIKVDSNSAQSMLSAPIVCWFNNKFCHFFGQFCIVIAHHNHHVCISVLHGAQEKFPGNFIHYQCVEITKQHATKVVSNSMWSAGIQNWGGSCTPSAVFSHDRCYIIPPPLFLDLGTWILRVGRSRSDCCNIS